MKEAKARVDAEAKETRESRLWIFSFFFDSQNDKDPLEKSENGLYRSLLAQVLEKIPCWPPGVLEQFRREHEQPNWISKELRKYLLQVLLSSHRAPTYIFIDALDECGRFGSEDQIIDPQESIAAFFEDVAKKAEAVHDGSPLYICISRRHAPVMLDKSPEIIVDHYNTMDVLRFIRSRVRCPPEYVKKVKKALYTKASGNFLWAVMVLQVLNTSIIGGLSEGEVNKILELIPKGFQEMIQCAFESIPDHCRDSSRQLFQWILLARRPLSDYELACALACTTPHETSATMAQDRELFDRDRLKKRITLLSAGLIEILPQEPNRKGTLSPTDLGTGRIQFIHPTVRQWFSEGAGRDCFQESSQGRDAWQRASHSMMERSCINYLSLKDLVSNTHIDTLIPHREEAIWFNHLSPFYNMYPFLAYAVGAIFPHAERARVHGLSQSELDQIHKKSFFGVWARFAIYKRALMIKSVFSTTGDFSIVSYVEDDPWGCLAILKEAKVDLVGRIRSQDKTQQRNIYPAIYAAALDYLLKYYQSTRGTFTDAVLEAVFSGSDVEPRNILKRSLEQQSEKKQQGSPKQQGL